MKKITFIILLLFATKVSAVENSILKINIERPYNYSGDVELTFVDEDTKLSWVEKVEGNYKEFIIPNHIKRLKVFENNRPKYYRKCELVFYPNFKYQKEANISINYSLKNSSLTTEAYYYSVKDNVYIGTYETDLMIYDINNELKETFKNNTTNKLNAGKYKVIDSKYHKDYEADIWEENSYLLMTQNVIDGFKVNTSVESICDDEKCYEFEQNGDIVILEDYLFPGEYYINNEKFILNDNTESIINELGNLLVINLPVKEENSFIDNKELIDVVESEKEEVIVVEVPNTGIEIKEIDYHYYVKKKYFI